MEPNAPVDLALVLAIDASGSVSNERMALQIGGYVQAFRQPELVGAIQGGPNRRIAATFVMWSEFDRQYQSVPWTVMSDGLTASQFADAIAAATGPTPGWTSISGAIRFCARLFQRLHTEAGRKVIDISGDGANNDGPPPGPERDTAVSLGITINGLPILEVEPSLDDYYRSEVIGGRHAFLVVARDQGSFAAAVLQKLLVEVAGQPSNRDP